MDSKRKVNGGSSATDDLDDRSAKRRKFPIVSNPLGSALDMCKCCDGVGVGVGVLWFGLAKGNSTKDVALLSLNRPT